MCLAWQRAVLQAVACHRASGHCSRWHSLHCGRETASKATVVHCNITYYENNEQVHTISVSFSSLSLIPILQGYGEEMS